MEDYREELLQKILVMLHDAGIEDFNVIKPILIRAISEYQVSERCTDLTVVDNGNIEMIKAFLVTKKIEGGSEKTAKTRWYVLNMFVSEVRKPFAEVGAVDVLRWIADVQSRVSLSTANSYTNIVKSMFGWLKQNNIIPNNPTEHIKAIKHPDPIKTGFTPIEIDSLKCACKTIEERAMVELLLSSGLRCEELCNLKWNDLNFTTNDVHVIEGKGNKNRVTMMDDVTKKYLLEYKNSIEYKSEYVFAAKYNKCIKERTTDSVWRRLKILAERADVDAVSPHRFRHTFATTMYKRGLDVRMIQRLLGHANINTTMIYIDSNLDALRDAYKHCY